jgi:hypothetical protein
MPDDRKISDSVSTVRLSDEYWPQYIIVENNSVKYPVKVEADVIYSIVYRRNESQYEKKKTLYSNVIPPMGKINVNLNINGSYIVRIEKWRVIAYTD